MYSHNCYVTYGDGAMAVVQWRAQVADSSDGTEQLSVDRAMRAVRRADVAVLVVDGTEGVTQQVWACDAVCVGLRGVGHEWPWLAGNASGRQGRRIGLGCREVAAAAARLRLAAGMHSPAVHTQATGFAWAACMTSCRMQRQRQQQDDGAHSPNPSSAVPPKPWRAHTPHSHPRTLHPRRRRALRTSA